MTTNEMYKNLSEPFPPEVERILNKGGASLTYIPVSEVVNRLNRILGVDKWSFTINKCERDKLDHDFIVAEVTIEAVFSADEDGRPVVIRRDGIGGQKIKRTRSGDIVDLGDEMKGAVSDALKKAAQTLGIGLYLARSEDAIESEIMADIPPVNPIVVAKWEQFTNLIKDGSAYEKEQVGHFWNEYTDGKPKPRLETISVDEVDALIEFVESMRAEAEA